jgi:hypothetical protein
MPTSSKRNKTRPGRKPKQEKNRGLRSVVAGLTSNLRPPKKSSRGRKSSKPRRSRIATGSGIGTRPLRPSRKGLVGIAAGAGLGGVAMATRRRRAGQNQATTWPPGEAASQDASATGGPGDANYPSGGGENEGPKGPGLADAA